ncbi:MAG: PAS domain-containing protein, partial [Bacteroidetes bacterium]|nr:PAS domain-containing protein [Bacteroidota bacterium]
LFKIDTTQHESRDVYVCTVDNAAARTLSGKKSLTGLQWKDFFGSVPQDTLALPTLDQEIYFADSDTWCRASNVPVDDNHFMCTLTDISARIVVQEREKNVLNILSDAEKAMQFGSWMCEVGGTSEEWSQGVFSLLGYTPEEAAALSPSHELFESHIHPEDLDHFHARFEEALAQKSDFRIEYRIQTTDNREKFMLSRGRFIGGDAQKPLTAIGSTFDLTSIKNIQFELERKVEELNRSNFDLEQFAYVASHDLQEPLRKIVSFGERLENRSKGLLDEEMGLYLDRILNATRRMQDMISNLLEFSRFARSKEGFAQTDLNDILKSTLSDLEVAIQNKEAILTYDNLPTIEAIPVQMSQLFNNLISNSLKFTFEEKRPVIEIRSEKLKKSDQIHYGLPSNRDYVRITLADNGIGFENNDSNRIFTLFQRLRGRSEYEGAGIGLSVCKKVVENHSGIILAAGKPDIGATFTIIIPISQS